MAEEASKYPGGEIQRLQFLMRSGNSFIASGVTNWSMKHKDGRVVGLTLNQRTDPQFAFVVVESIDLAQIEAVVVLPTAEVVRG